MKRIAANKVMIDPQTLCLNTVIECDDMGVVTSVFPLANQISEPAQTSFFNGLITTEVSMNNLVIGTFIPNLLTHSLLVGYQGKLILWQNINLTTLKITSDTQISLL